MASDMAMRFLPALTTCAVWLYVMAQKSLWSQVFGTHHYVMSVAMIFGSLIAGSTPLGGGVVAFPVAVLVLGLSPAQGRDFTLLIQSVGMNAATYMIMRTRPHLVDTHFVTVFVAGGVPGVLLAIALELPPFATVLTFQLLVLEFAVVYAYLSVLAPRRAGCELTLSASDAEDQDLGQGAAAGQCASVTSAPVPSVAPLWWLVDVVMVCAALVGGFFTGSCGSGSNILLYAFGVLVWNPNRHPRAAATLTASSVVVMGLLSLVGAAARAMTGSVAPRVYLCWGASAFIVCWGAPLGSLLLTPRRQAYLRLLFYILAVAQFVGFAVLKMRGDAIAWITFGAITLVVLMGMGAHAWILQRNMRAHGVAPERITFRLIARRIMQ
jgi:uncharacterized membrane protein YfcA